MLLLLLLLDPAEFSVLSMSMPPLPAAAVGVCSTTLLLWRRWRFDEARVAEVREGGGGTEEAPGPGAFLGGAAAMGTTPLPAAAAEAAVEEEEDVALLPG